MTKEARFIVTTNEGHYFDGDIIFFSSGNIMSGNTTSDKYGCFVFTDIRQAEAVATLVNGQVESF